MSSSLPTLVITKPLLPEQLVVQRALLADRLGPDSAFNHLMLPVFKLLPFEPALTQMLDFMNTPLLDSQRMVVFVSPSALEMAFSMIQQWPDGLFCGVMGNQSAALAAKLGVPQSLILAPGFEGNQDTEDSQGLFNLMTARFKGPELTILVCKGPRGRDDFPLKLRDAGFSVTVLETYDRQVIHHEQAQLQGLLGLKSRAVLWITSSETIAVLDSALSQLGTDVLAEFKQEAQVLTTHPRITRKCMDLGYANVVQIATGIESVKTWMVKLLQGGGDAAEPVAPRAERTQTQTNNMTGQNTHSMNNVSNAGSGSNGLVKAAFLMSLSTLILLVLVVFFAKDQLETTKQAFGERIQKESTTLELMESQVSQSSDAVRDIRARIELIQKSQEEASSQRAALEAVYNNLLASRSVVSVSEIDQLVSIAKRQLFVLGNPNGAKLALGQALELLERTDRPLLMGLKSALEKDLADLNALPDINVLEHAIELDSIIDSAQTLPMLSGSTLVTDMTLAELSHGGAGQDNIEPIQHNPNPFQWVWSFTTELLSTAWEDIKGLIEITKVKSPEVLLITAKESNDLRNTLRLSLLNARISLLSRHSQLLNADLKRSQAVLETYFDVKNVQVQRSLEVIRKMEGLELSLTLPELKNTTSALRLVQSGEGDKK